MNYILEYLDSAFLYFLILIFSVLFAFIAQIAKSKLASSIFVTIVILILALPAGLRNDTVGIDTSNYLLIIRSAGSNYFGEPFYTYYEIGFQWLLKFLMIILKEPHYVLLFISLVTNALMIRTLWFFKDKISFSLSVFLFFCLHYFETYNISRQWLAISIVFFAARYLFDKKYFKYCIFVFISSLLHGSAIISLLFVPVHISIVKKVPLKYKMLMGLSALVFAMFYNYFLNVLGITSTIDKYQYYLQEGTTTMGVGFLFVIRLMVIFTAIWLLISKKYNFQDIHFIKNIIVINIFGTASMFLGYIFIFAVRLGAYATVFEIILFSMITRTRSFSILIRLAVVLLGLYLFYSSLNSSSQGHMPYNMFFNS